MTSEDEKVKEAMAQVYGKDIKVDTKPKEEVKKDIPKEDNKELSKQEEQGLIVDTNPHIKDSVNTEKIMWTVIIALIPTIIAAVYFFKFKSVGMVKVKGKEKALEAYELVGRVERPKSGLERKIISDMVGRDKELELLKDLSLKAVEGQGSIVNVIGEAGIGKSRLLAELKKTEVMSQVILLEGKAISTGRNLSFLPIISVLKHWARIKDDDSEEAAFHKVESAVRYVCGDETNEIFPFIATLMRLRISGKYAERVKGIEGEALEKLILKNMRDFLTKGSQIAPLILVTEDLHWADTSSIELLGSLFRLVETQRILFINVFRPGHEESGGEIIKTIKERYPDYYTEVQLQALDDIQCETLINNILNIKELPNTVKEKIFKRADGNPFFIEEVVRSFIDEGVVIVKNGAFEITEKIDTVVIPHTINDVLIARIDRLEEDTRNLLKTASVIGRNFFFKILAEVAKEIKDIDTRLDYLKHVQLIRERMRMAEIEYLFKHALAQEAAYESLLIQKRQEIHLMVAESIEKVFHERLHEFYGMLAMHYTMAEELEKAEEYLVKAGDEALMASASAEALNYFQEALDLYEKREAAPEIKAMLYKNIAVAFYNRGRVVESVEYLTKALAFHGQKEIEQSISGIFTFLIRIIYFFTGLYIPFVRWRKVPSKKEQEILSMFIKKDKMMISISAKKFFIESLNQSSLIFTYDPSMIEEGPAFLSGLSTTFSMTGISYRLAKKLLDVGKDKINKDDAKSMLFYELCSLIVNFLTGETKNLKSYDEDLVSQNIRLGEYWNASGYIYFYTPLYIEQGKLLKAEELINKTNEIGDTYEYEHALTQKFVLKSKLLLKCRRLKEGMAEWEKGINFVSNMSHLLRLYSIGSTIHLTSGNLLGAKKALSKATGILSETDLPPVWLNYYHLAQLALDMFRLENQSQHNSKSELSKAKKQAFISAKKAVKSSKKIAFDRIETYRSMGIYYWLIGKQKKALKWWDKSINEGNRLGARLELSRTYFEIGKRLLEPESKYESLSNIKADEYLGKAEAMFGEMDLQWDLEELHKLKDQLSR